jgi:3-deoxy-manno-octulosonate cytidylyltransferase (CMP-KDO synthetase)
MNRVIAIIPTRMGSTRFPGKALASETGRALVLHVVDAVLQAAQVNCVVVASEDAEIEAACRQAGVEHVMTANTHPNGSSRMAEVAAKLEADVFLNVQGDEPEIDPTTIDVTLEALAAMPSAGVATAAAPLGPEDDPNDPNIVKVVTALDGSAIYFSRACIPTGVAAPLRHVGLYAFRPDVLARYPSLPPTPLEQSERLEQLRLIEHGIRVAVARVESSPPGIDTPEQYAAFVARWRLNHPD